jgi:hypothetical protein
MMTLYRAKSESLLWFEVASLSVSLRLGHLFFDHTEKRTGCLVCPTRRGA